MAGLSSGRCGYPVDPRKGYALASGMKVQFTERFLEDYSRLPQSGQTKCRTLLKELAHTEAKVFASQPLPGWRLHKLRSSPFCSLSLDMNFRLLAKAEGENLFLHRLVKHDAADSPHVNRNDSSPVSSALAESGFGPADLLPSLLALGVPQELVAPLKGVRTEDELLEALGELDASPRELALALYETSGLVVPRTCYRLFQNDDDLELALRGSREEWNLYLHPSQKFVAELPSGSRTLVSGSAGTGKTVCAWYHVRFLTTQPGGVVFVCPNKDVMRVSRERIKALVGGALNRCVMMVPGEGSDLTMCFKSARHLVADEAQEFPPSWLTEFTAFMSAHPKSGFTLFYDLNQTNRLAVAPSKERKVVGEIEAGIGGLPHTGQIRLSINYRNSREVAEFFVRSLAGALPWPLISELPLFECGDVVSITAQTEEVAWNHVAAAVRQLGRDFAYGDIAIVSFGGVNQRGRIRDFLKRFNFPVATEFEVFERDAVMLCHPRVLKGHEKKAVIAVMPPIGILAKKFKHAMNAYIAFSRARDRLVVVHVASDTGAVDEQDGRGGSD